MSEPKSLQEAIVYFSNPDNCIDYLAKRRWPKGVVCPDLRIGSRELQRQRRTWKCSTHHPKREFSVKVGTIFEDSPIGLDKWLAATWMLTNCKNGISSYEVARALGVTQKSAWFMMHRIRLALQDQLSGSSSGEVEVDETFIGGKARNMHCGQARAPNHWNWRKRQNCRHGNLGARREGSHYRCSESPQESRFSNKCETCAAGAALYTDALQSYDGLVARVRAPSDRPCGKVRGRKSPHQRTRKLLVPLEARHQRNLCQCRTVSSFPLP